MSQDSTAVAAATFDDVQAWANNNTALLIVGPVVILSAAILVARALRRAKAVREGAVTAEERDNRARKVEDVLTLMVAGVASGLSMTGLWRYAGDTLDLHGLWRAAPYFGLDAAVIVCAIRARRRVRNNMPAGINGRLVWGFAVISAAFGYSEGGSTWGGFGRAIWPIVAATLFELGLIEQKRAAEKREDRRVGIGPWAHPIERLRVQANLSAHSSWSADEATHIVRVSSAAKALYRLRQVQDDIERIIAKDKHPGMWVVAKERRAERKAQKAINHAGGNDPRVWVEIASRMQALVRTRDLAAADYSTVEAVMGLANSSLNSNDVRGASTRARTTRPAQARTDASLPTREDAPELTRGDDAARGDSLNDERQLTRPTPSGRRANPAKDALYAIYAKQLDAARDAGQEYAADEMSPMYIGEQLGISDAGNARTVRLAFRNRYAAERGGLDVDRNGVRLVSTNDVMHGADPERDPIEEQATAGEIRTIRRVS